MSELRSSPARDHAAHAAERARHLDLAARRIRHDIERALRARTAPPGTVAAKVEARVKAGGQRAWSALQKRPSVGVALAGGLVLAAAMEVGVGELALAFGTGYATYLILRRKVPLEEAIAEARDLVE